MTTQFDQTPTEQFIDAETADSSPASLLNFSAEVADRLLDKLGNDDGFRALFLLNPRAALALVGHCTPEADRDIKGRDPVLCLYSMKKLATKAEIFAARKSLHAALSTSVFHYAVSI